MNGVTFHSTVVVNCVLIHSIVCCCIVVVSCVMMIPNYVVVL